MIKSQQLSIILSANSIIQEKSGKVTGTIYWDVEGSCFPDTSWNDFIIIIINWWTDAICRIINHQSLTEAFDFMDGPYFIKCRVKNDCICLTFNARKLNTINYSCIWKGRASDLGKEIHAVGKKALRVCYRNQYMNDDIALLEKSNYKLRKLLEELNINR